MNIVFFSHPVFLGSISTQKYAKWLADGMKQRGHQVQLWIPQPRFFNLPVSQSLKKWFGYFDQYVLFPRWVKNEIKKQPEDTLYVFVDHSLGIWAPLIKDYRHVVHCHDFLAQYSALGKIKENPIGWTGRKYQEFIRNGFRHAKNFISISEKTREDLHDLLGRIPAVSEVVYNGMAQPYKPAEDVSVVLSYLQTATGIELENGYILHVGANQWNKNRRGVIEIYSKWRKKPNNRLPLLMIGPEPDDVIMKAFHTSAFRNDIHFLIDKTDEFVSYAYQAASVFIFPTLAEGFGWPIAEAMASGIPVITTQEAPMTEVAGNAALYFQRRPIEDEKVEAWATDSAKMITKLLSYNQEERQQLIDYGLMNVKRFDSEQTILKFEKIYHAITGRPVASLPLKYNTNVSA
jgi:glycosyltransferase involved in cell wall biosynthesis